MQKRLVIVKLGGSALTDKNKIYTARKPAIHHAASQIARIADKRQVVLVHGAGSFGHIPVKKFGLSEGFKSTKQLRGLAHTKHKLLEWETLIDEISLRHKVPLIPFLTSDLIVARRGRIVSSTLKPLRESLRLGCVPTLGGDIVMDTVNGFSVVSGDQLAAFLAIQLGASRLVFGVDVEGIFDSNPKLNDKARLLTKLSTNEALGFATNPKTTAHTTIDVTGGMAGKIKEAIIAARNGIPVQFVSLTKNSRLVKAALGLPVPGSTIIANR